MVLRSISKFMMLYVANTNVVPCSVTSNFQSDSIYNTRQRVLQRNKHMPLNIRQQCKSRLSSIKYSKQMIWTIKILLGMSTV